MLRLHNTRRQACGDSAVHCVAAAFDNGDARFRGQRMRGGDHRAGRSRLDFLDAPGGPARTQDMNVSYVTSAASAIARSQATHSSTGTSLANAQKTTAAPSGMKMIPASHLIGPIVPVL